MAMAQLDKLSASLNDLQALRILIPNASATELDRALSFAAVDGNLKAVRELIPHVKTTGGGQQALVWAAYAGHGNVVAELIKRCDVNDQDGEALRGAAKEGHLGTTRKLIAHGDLIARTALALRLALDHGHTKMVENLIRPRSVSKVFRHEVTQAMENEYDGSFELIDRLSVEVGRNMRRYALKALHPLWQSRTPKLKDWHETEMNFSNATNFANKLYGQLPKGKRGRRTGL